MKKMTFNKFLKSELARTHSEIQKNGEFVFMNPEDSYQNEIRRYTEEVHELMMKNFFVGFSFRNNDIDRRFKKLFVNYFLDRKWLFETSDKMASAIYSTLLMEEDYINMLYDNIEYYINGYRYSHTEAHSEGKTAEESGSDRTDRSSGKSRGLNADLPQSQVNINLDNSDFQYGSTVNATNNTNSSSGETNTAREGENETDSNSTTISNDYDIEKLEKINGILRKIVNRFDSYCFSQLG